jgi:hypothetical protein
LNEIDEFLAAGETVVWKGKPLKKTVFLQSLAGIPFALIFGSVGIVSTLYMDVPLLSFPLLLLALSLCLVLIPPVWFLRRLSDTEYVITNQRLIIKTGPTKYDVWTSENSKIKGIVVKTGIGDKFLGTAKLYPITKEYPYDPKARVYSRNGVLRLRKVYNLITGVYDEISEAEFYRKSFSRPHLEGIEQPQTVKRLFYQTIEMVSLNEEAPLHARLSIIQKAGLGLGTLLVVAGLLVFAWGYLKGYTPYISYTAGYTFIDQVGIVGYGLLFPGVLLLILTAMSLLYKK